MKFYDWLSEKNATTNKDNIFAPPMDAQTAIYFLKDYLLGEDYYTVNPISTEQLNTEIVYDIISKYSKRFKKEIVKNHRMAMKAIRNDRKKERKRRKNA